MVFQLSSFDKWFDDFCDIMTHVDQFNVNLLNIEDSSVIPYLFPDLCLL